MWQKMMHLNRFQLLVILTIACVIISALAIVGRHHAVWVGVLDVVVACSISWVILKGEL